MVTLRDYQRQEVDFMVQRGRCINGSEMGTGKTVTTLFAARERFPGADVLVLAPKNALGVWQRHIGAILGEPATMYTGSVEQRAPIPLHKNGWIVAPYSMMEELIWRRHEWPLIVADEAHCLRNRTTETLYKTFRQFQYDGLFALTGSPIVNNVDDVWTLLNLIDDKTFSSYWKFIDKYFYKFKGEWGEYLIGQARNPIVLRDLIHHYMVRHTKAAVVTELPDKIRQAIPVEMTAVQLDAYDQLAEEMLVEWPNGKILLVPNAVAKVTRLRQILVTPALVGGPHSSGAFDLLEDALANEFDAGRACVVFTPFAEALPLLEKLTDKLKARSGIIRGGMSARALDRTVYDFEAYESKKKTLLCSTRMSTSWTATSASSCFFLGQDFAPMYNHQAEDRLHRLGQRDVVHANYFVHYGTIEEHVLEILDGKVRAANVLKEISDLSDANLHRLLYPGGDNGSRPDSASARLVAGISQVLSDSP